MFKDYFQEPGLVNGHVHYTSSDGYQAIWWSKGTLSWAIGNANRRGSARKAAFSGTNILGILGKPDCPHDVAFTWEYWNPLWDKWMNADKGLSIWCKS